MTPREYLLRKIAHYKDVAEANRGKPERWAIRSLALRLKRENEDILRRLDANNGRAR